MSVARCVLFDADGVLTLPEEMFSVVYARSHGIDQQLFEEFFKNDWHPIVTGNKDLKESIAANPELWQWSGTTEELLEYWFKTEDIRNEELLNVIAELKNIGLHCYVATDQEKYRAEYMKNVMFKGLFDGYFVSCELGVTKTNPQFFELVLQKLKVQFPNLKPSNVIFIDDSQSKVSTAKALGIDARLFKTVDEVRNIIQ